MPVEVENFEPESGVPGQRITVLGSGFVRGTKVIFWMDVEGTGVVVDSDEELTVTVPERARTGIVIARNANGEGRSVKSFEVEDPGPVRVNRFNPSHGQTSEQITIFGQGFNAIGNRTVKFGPYQATQIRWVSDTQIIASVPMNAPKNARVKIEVTTPAGSGRSLTDFLVD